MIKIDRTTTDPACLASVSAAEAHLRMVDQQGLTELEKARQYYATIPTPTKTYEFVRYAEYPVCVAVDRLFLGKCAFCESQYSATASRNVEHFRPKGGVTESKGQHPGYWWLAGAWSNLLASCPPCNQRRKHFHLPMGVTLAEYESLLYKRPNRSTGKANSFPVRGNKWVTDETKDLASEDPFLINPSDRDPANHLEWRFDWDRQRKLWQAPLVIALICPRRSNGTEDIYGATSISTLGLNRAGLVRDRAARLKVLQLTCRLVVDCIERQRKYAPDFITDYHITLSELAAPDQPYAGMADAFIRIFSEELTTHFSP